MQYFKELLDDINSDEDIVMQLEGIIENVKYDDLSRWKKYFIEMPEILESMYLNKDCRDPDNKFVFFDPKRFISKRSSDQILLLERTMTTSINREYYSYVLFLKAKKEAMNVGYFTTYNENTEKYLTYTNNRGDDVRVLYMKDEQSENGEYKYIAMDAQSVLYKGNLEGMLDYIKQQIQ